MTKLTIHNGDNFHFVKDGSVDFVLTDPPFNISKKTNFASYEKNTIHSYQFDGKSNEAWDTYSHEEFLQKLDDWSAEWARVLRRGGSFAIFCADAYISHLMEALKKNKLVPRRLITWRKNNAVPINRQYMPTSANEYIIVGVKEGKNVTFNSDVPILNQTLDQKTIEATIVADKVSTIVYSQIKEAILAGNDVSITDKDHLDYIAGLVKNSLEHAKKDGEKKTIAMYKKYENGSKYLQACVPNYVQNPLKVGNRIHPTEKPVLLLQYLVALYSNTGDTILDGFGGSGSSGEAALVLERNAIIIEREKEFFQKLVSRLTPKATIIQEI